MTKNRIEAFSDGVLAIIVTIMVLEMKVPRGATWSDIAPILDTFISYILSFVFILIYWNNHHHLFQAVKHVNGRVLWANGHLLFWLSLLPFVSGWMGVNHFASLPVLFYAIVAFMSGFAYYLLTLALWKIHDNDSVLRKGVGNKKKEMVSLYLYLAAIGFACFIPFVSCCLFVIVSITWLIPNKNIEKIITPL
jgi:uncharacterized membrane protein